MVELRILQAMEATLINCLPRTERRLLQHPSLTWQNLTSAGKSEKGCPGRPVPPVVFSCTPILPRRYLSSP